MITKMPYFLTNENWYKYNYDTGMYELTDLAPEEARKSYEELYKNLEEEIPISFVGENKITAKLFGK